MNQKSLIAMLVVKNPGFIATEVNAWNPLQTRDKSHKVKSHISFDIQSEFQIVAQQK